MVPERVTEVVHFITIMPNKNGKNKTTPKQVDITINESPTPPKGQNSSQNSTNGGSSKRNQNKVTQQRGGRGVRNPGVIRDPSSYMSVVRALGSLPMSSAGRAAFWSAVHPPTAPSDQLGLPDAATTPRNICRVATNWNLQWDPSYFDTPPPTTVTQFDALVITPPIPEVAAIVMLRASGDTAWSNAHVFRRNAMDHITPANNTFGGLRSEGFSTVRITGHSSTFYFNGASIRDEGSITCAAFIPQLDVRDFTVSSKDIITNADVLVDSARRTLVTVPSDTETLTGTNPRSYIGAARNGLFTISKFTASLMGYPFKEAANEVVINNSGSGTGSLKYQIPASFLALNLSINGVATPHTFDTFSHFTTVSPAIAEPGFPSQALHAFVSDPSDMTWNVAIFEKIDVQSGFKVKDIVNFDAYVPLNSTRGWDSKAPPILDMRALEYIVVAHQEMPDGFPSAANDFMDFLKSIGRGVAKGFSAVSGVLGPLISSIPHPLAKVIGMGIPAVGGLLGSLTADRQPSEIPLD